MRRRRSGEGLEPVWIALSDPTRRAILDRLRDRPQTTGELAAAFPQSRFAVMKHLAVLVAAGLVLARREGRTRWNHLNAVPLQQLYERWVRPYEAAWAGRVLRLKQVAETQPGEPIMATADEKVGVVRVEVEVPIATTPQRVWEAMTKEITKWWRPDFYTLSEPKGFVLELKAGGRGYEYAAGGAEVLWYTVITLEPGKALELFGSLMPRYGGPAMTTVRWEVLERNGQTVVRISDAICGRVTEGTAASFEDGWQKLFGEGLKPYVEKTN